MCTVKTQDNNSGVIKSSLSLSRTSPEISKHCKTVQDYESRARVVCRSESAVPNCLPSVQSRRGTRKRP